MPYTQGTTINTATASENPPTAVGVDGAGNAYFLISGTIYKATYSGGSYTVASIGVTVPNISYIAVDPNGIIYAASSLSSSVSTQYLTRFTPSQSGYSSTALLFGTRIIPLGLSVDPAGNAFIVLQVPDAPNGPNVLEVPAGSTTSSNLVTLSTSITGFTVDSNDNLFFNYVGQDGTISEIPRTNGAYPYSGFITPITALCHATSGCSITALSADAGGNIYSSYITDGSGGSERYLALGSNTFSPGYVFTGSQSPEKLAVGATGIVYTIDSTSDNIVTHLPPAGVNAGSLDLVDNPGGSSTIGVNFLLDASIVYQGTTFVSSGSAPSFTLRSSATCGGNACVAGTTYPAGTAIALTAYFASTTPGVSYGAVNLNSTSGTVATANLYGTEFGPLLTFNPGVVSPVVQAGGSLTLRSPAVVATDGNSNAYVLDTRLMELIKIASATGQTTVLATGVTGSAVPAPAVDGAGNVYFVQTDPSHSGLFELVRLNTANGGSTYSGTTVLANSLVSPAGIGLDPNGDVFIVDSSINAVTEYVNISGAYIPRTVLSGLSNVSGLAVGPDGSLYIATTAGLFKSVPNNLSYGTPTLLTPASDTAYGVALDGSGNIYVNDAGNGRVLRLSPGGSSVTTLYTSSNATVSGIAATPTGNVLLAQASTGALNLLNTTSPPSVSFASAPVGSTSSDSPKTLSVYNTGNEAVPFGGGTSITGPFSIASGSTCPAAFSNQTPSLAANNFCSYLLSFTPTAVGAQTGSLQTKYYANSSNSTTTVTDALSGTGTQGAPTIAVTNASEPYATGDTMLTATIAYSGPAPTGTVTFALNTPTPISVTAQQCLAGSNNTLTCTGRPNVQAVPAGTYTITVTEAADTNYAAASGTGTLTLTPQSVTPSAVSMPSSVTYGTSSITFTSYTGYPSYNAAAPTGSLNFTVDGTINVAATCNSANPRVCTATYNPSALGVGTHTLAATLAADTNYTAGNSGSGATFTVTTATPTAAVNSSTVAYGATSTVLTATFAYSGPTAPTGNVTFSINNGAAINATCTGTASPRNCTITYNPSSLAGGTYTVQASEAADTNYAAASASGSLTVSTSAPAVSVAPATAVYGTSSVTLNAAISFSGSTAPTGQVTLSVNNGTPLQATCSTSGSARNCTATYNPQSLAGGSYSVQASEAADSNFGVATGSGTLTISAAAPTLTVAPASTTYGSTAVTLSSTLTYTGTAAPSGQATFTVNGTTLVPATCSGSSSPRTCTAAFTPSSLSAGQYSLQASLTADTNYTAATSQTATLTIATATPTASASNTSAAFGSPSTTLNAAIVYAGSVAPTGQVSFSVDGGTPVTATCAISASTRACSAAVNTATLTVGAHTFTATEAADTNYAAATSPAATLTIGQAGLTLTASPVTGSAGGSPVTLTATEAYTGSTVPTGAVAFQVNGTTLNAACIGTASPRTCSASLDVSRFASGTYTYTVSSAADGNYAAATAQSTVSLSTSSTTLSSRAVTATYGTTPLALTATLTYSGTATPTGATSFVVDGTSASPAVCTGTASPQTCTGSYTGAALAGGTHTLTASFAGDNAYAPAVSPAATITITPATPVVMATSTSAAYGAATTVLNAAVSYTGPTAPTGTVRFLVDGTTSVSAFCSSGTGSLTCSANFASGSLAVGQHTLSASITADSNYAAATSPGATLTISSAAPAISVASVLAPYGATSVNLVATISNLQSTPPTGAVSFLLDGSTTLPSNCTFAGSVRTCIATYNPSALAVGTHTLIATQAADGNYTQVTSAAATLSVVKGTPQLTAPAVTVPSGTSKVTLTAAVAYTGATAPSGAVTFTLTGSSPITATCAGTASPLNCAAALSLSSIPAGTYSFTASIAADGNYQAATATSTLTVSPGAASTFPTCTLGSIKSVSSTSNAVSVNAACTDPGNLALTTTIDWGDGTSVLPAVNNGANTHTYASPSSPTTYTVVLAATNTSGSTGTTTEDITVLPIITVPAGGTSVSTPVASQPATLPVLQVTFLCTSVSTNVSGQSVTNALPSSYGISCTSPVVNSTASGSVQVKIQTSGAVGTSAMLSRSGRSLLAEALLLPFLGLPLFAFAGAERRGKLLSLAILSLAVCTLGLYGCGGSFQPPATATPKGNYYITITEVTAAGTQPPTGFVQTSLIVPLTVQ